MHNRHVPRDKLTAALRRNMARRKVAGKEVSPPGDVEKYPSRFSVEGGVRDDVLLAVHTTSRTGDKTR